MEQKVEWVTLMTFSTKEHDAFYEEGAIYDFEPECSWTTGARPFVAGEHVVACPRCGQRFAATANTAEANRDLHFDGDEDIPSICRHLPTRLTLVRN